MEIKHQDEQFIEWDRRQFSVRPAFAMTINKGQGQTQKSIGSPARGAYINSWQLYVAASSVGDLQHLHFAVGMNVSRKTNNVVYEEILLTGEVVSSPTEVPLSLSLLK